MKDRADENKEALRVVIWFCWVCSPESKAPIRARVDNAKNNQPGKCNASDDWSLLMNKYLAYDELGSARDEENSCWVPPHQPHLDEALKAHEVARQCIDIMILYRR